MKKIGKILGYINSVLVMVIIFPFALIFGLISVVLDTSIEKQFKFLKRNGYKYKSGKGYKYYSRNFTTFRFKRYCSYEIKIGSNEFINVENTNIGSDYERDVLIKTKEDYQNAHPVDIQRGEIDTITPFAEFIERHLKELESLTNMKD